MRKKLSAFMPFLSGITYSALLFLAVRGLVHHAKSIFGVISNLFTISDSAYISEILAGLEDAKIGVPWLFLIIFAVIFALMGFILRIKISAAPSFSCAPWPSCSLFPSWQ